ncbi:hypothetical protein [Dactylosporangium sp. NPDC000521]|uniref:hypothetical protein n=1 Tax=Dactylosporangium sp. NPDC000521 TaxID=3363975 RepID=UPI0036AA95AF
MVRFGGLVTRAALLCGASAFAVLLVLVSHGVVKADDTWIVWVAVAQAVCTSVEPTRSLVETWRRPGRRRMHADLSRVLQQGTFRIADQAGVSVQSLGLSVFRLPGSPRKRALEQIQRHRFDDHPGPSHIRWTRGKGLVGLCWLEQAPVHRDLRRIAVQVRRNSVRAYAAAGDASAGLSLTEFERVAAKYAEVYAMPVNDAAGTMIGILVVDIPFQAGTNGAPRLSRPDVEQAIATVAVLAGRLLS